MVGAAMALIAAAPAGALAAGEESASSAPVGTVTESPGGSTEPAAPAPSPSGPAPASTGWVPGAASTETSSKGAESTQRGSSLGSGVGSSQAGSAGSTSKDPPRTIRSSGSYEPESSVPSTSTFEAPTSTSDAGSAPEVVSGAGAAVKPPPPEHHASKDLSAAVGDATLVALSKSPQGGDASPALPAAVAPLANRGDQTASGSGPLSLLALIVFGLIVLYAGGRLVMGGPFEPLRR